MRDPFAEDELRRKTRRRERLQADAYTVEGDVSALRRLQDRGWRLGADDDLDAISASADRVMEVYSPMEWGSKLLSLVSDARQAVRTERNRRNLEYQREVEKQRHRVRSIHLAAKHIEDATRELGIADGIEDRRGELLPRETIGAIDTDHMGVRELEQAISLDERAMAREESSAEEWTHAAELLLSAKGEQFRRYAKVAKAIAAEHAEDAEAHRSRLQALRAARDSRASLEAMDEDALRQRVAELEQALANGTNR